MAEGIRGVEGERDPTWKERRRIENEEWQWSNSYLDVDRKNMREILMSNTLTPQQALMLYILQNNSIDADENTSPEDIEDLFDDQDYHDDLFQLRFSGEITNLPAPPSRHYETEQVAIETPVGWVSWTYWCGGGKHGNPEEIEWFEDAFFVDVEEKEVIKIERTFFKKD